MRIDNRVGWLCGQFYLPLLNGFIIDIDKIANSI